MKGVIHTQAYPAADADQRPLAKRYQAEPPVEQRTAEHGQRHAVGLGEIRQPIAAGGHSDGAGYDADHRDDCNGAHAGRDFRLGRQRERDSLGGADFVHSRAPTPWPAPTIIRKIRAAT